jgi:small-conductance mechanosensitive channel
VGDVEGTVLALGMLSTKVRTTKREEITLPNAVVIGASVKNYSRGDAEPGLLTYTSVTIGYDTPWRQVEALLLMAATRTEGLRREPAPFVLKPALSDFYVEYQLNAGIERPEERNRVLDELHANILDCFNEYGVQIMSPHYEGDPERPAVVPRERWHAPPARDGSPSTGPAPRGTPAGD